MSTRLAELDQASSSNSSIRSNTSSRAAQGRRSREQSPASTRSRPPSRKVSTPLTTHRLRSDPCRPTDSHPHNGPTTRATARSDSPRRTVPVRRPTARRRYPPTPYVEDVPRSMAEKTDHFEAPTPGLKDQYPIVINVEEERRFASEPLKSSKRNHKRDSKMDTGTDNSMGAQDSGTSSRRGTQRPSTPQSSSRPASPSNIWTPASSVLTNDSGYYSSSTSGSRTPTESTEKRKGVAFGADRVSNISAIDAEMRKSSRRKPATAFESTAPVSRESLGSRNPMKTATPRLSDIKAEMDESSGRRRASDLSSTTIRPDLSDLAHPLPSRRREDVLADRSRPTSPASTIGSSQRSPPESSRRISKTSYFDMPQSQSPRSSISGSASRPRPSSPITSAQPSPQSEDDFISPGPRRASTFPAKLVNAKRTSSLLSDPAIHPDDIPSSRHQTSRQSLNASVPYPVQSMLAMPSVEEHAYRPSSKDDMEMPRVSASAKAPRPASLEVPKSRPGLSSRNTATGVLPSLKTGMAAVLGSSSMMSSPTSASTASPTSSRKVTRSCWEKTYPDDCRDWCYLSGFANVSICPGCMTLRFRGTSLEQDLRPLQRRRGDPIVVCCFTSSWYKTAYELTMTRKAGNLKLFERLARADDGDTKSSNDRWHKLEPERGATSVMHLCPREAAKMKALFPYIRDSFIETSARQSGRCAMHAESSRLETFLQMLQEADGKAEYSSKPRLEKLLDYHEKMSRVAECPGDALVSDVRWHYAPSCPQLTVCRDCFVNMVYPKIKDRSRVAERIKPTDAYVESEQYIGTACQLWSPRMKRVFASAVKNDDFEYLAKRVEERVMAQQRTSKMIDGFQHEKAQLLRKQASDGRAGATKKDLADREADIEALKDDFEYRLQ